MAAYAVVRMCGKQHRVTAGERLWVDRMPGAVGDAVTLDEVLLLGGQGEPRIGQPLVEGAKVAAKIVDHRRGPKIRVFKRRRRKGFHKTIGHRQEQTAVEIVQIAGSAGAAEG